MVEPDVLVVGESLVDVVRTADGAVHEHPGGSAANVAVALARLGRPVRLATAFAEDDRGAVLERHLRGSGVGSASDPHTLARTSTAEATIGADGSAAYTFDLQWVLAPLDEVGAPRAVHVCSLGAVLDPGAGEVLHLLRRLRPVATVTYDVNARPAATGTGPGVVAKVEAVAALADVVKLSDEDLAALWPGRSEAAALERLLGLGPAAVVVTRGGSGASWISGSLEVHVPSVPVTVADTIGAGDTFAAGLIDALWGRGLGPDGAAALAALGEEEVVEVLEHAVRAAAVTVSRAGADPPYRHELDS